MTEFTPGSAWIGGMMIGLAASGLLFAHGRIAGISGILGAALAAREPREERSWRIAFLLGLPLGAAAASAWLGDTAVQVAGSVPLLMGAGVFVGVGTQIGSGCTSGHGVCGIARFSGRSVVATFTFIAVAALVVFVRRAAGV